MKKGIFPLVTFLAYLLLSCPLHGQNKQDFQPPLGMERLKRELSYARGPEKPEAGWPRTIKYRLEIYDFKTDTFRQEDKISEIKRKPCRIIPHSVGVTEILWAICPRERLVAFNEFAADPEFCVIADRIKEKGQVFKATQTELVIGYEPDLVFTVFYSDTVFKDKLKQAKIPYFDLGYFGTIESVKNQILLIGKIIGEEGNAEALVNIMDDKVERLKKKLPKAPKPIRALYYAEGGYIPGKSTNFNSICELIGVINVGAEKGIKSWSQVDYEMLLKWDPDIIIVPRGSNLKEQLVTNKILAHTRAIKGGKLYHIPRVYISINSQYMILSANLLAGIVYENTF